MRIATFTQTPFVSLLIPCPEQKIGCRVVIKPFEDLPVEAAFTLSPPRHWQIPIMYSSHEDLGYCAYIDKLHYECYEYLKKAMELCDKYDGFRYVIEHIWWLEAFDFYAEEQEKEHELLIGGIDKESAQYIRIDKSNTRLVAMKKAENGRNAIIIRLAETAGQRTDGEISLFFNPEKAVLCTNDERDIRPVQTDKNRVNFSIPPFSCITLKVYGDFNLSDGENV